MHKPRIYRGLWTFLSAGVVALAAAQVSSNPISIRSIAEVESGGRLIPADRVVSGDTVIYTLEVRNSGATTAPAPIVTFPIPAHMAYVADSAVGPGTEISYSVDGGRSFDTPEYLRIKQPNGQMRAAVAEDYSAIRWQLKNKLKANSVAFVRFRAIVKQ